MEVGWDGKQWRQKAKRTLTCKMEAAHDRDGLVDNDVITKRLGDAKSGTIVENPFIFEDNVDSSSSYLYLHIQTTVAI